jgi:hypothetical protein
LVKDRGGHLKLQGMVTPKMGSIAIGFFADMAKGDLEFFF